MIPFASDGSPALGRPAFTETTDFTEGALPSFLNFAVGSAGATNTFRPATTPGGLDITPAAGSLAGVERHEITLSNYKAVRLRVALQSGGTWLEQPRLRLSSATSGAELAQYDPNLKGQQLRVLGANGATTVETYISKIHRSERCDYSLLIDVAGKEVIVMLGEQVVEIWPNLDTLMGDGAVTPGFTVGVGMVRLRRFTLERWL